MVAREGMPKVRKYAQMEIRMHTLPARMHIHTHTLHTHTLACFHCDKTVHITCLLSLSHKHLLYSSRDEILSLLAA